MPQKNPYRRSNYDPYEPGSTRSERAEADKADAKRRKRGRRLLEQDRKAKKKMKPGEIYKPKGY